jgi:queuine/archaeosine tRNA-ribosyltransferase
MAGLRQALSDGRFDEFVQEFYEQQGLEVPVLPPNG